MTDDERIELARSLYRSLDMQASFMKSRAVAAAFDRLAERAKILYDDLVALAAAVATPQTNQEPVAWRHRDGTLQSLKPDYLQGHDWTPLYTHPAPEAHKMEEAS